MTSGHGGNVWRRRRQQRWEGGGGGVKKEITGILPDVKLEKSEAVQVQLEHVGGSFWVLKNGSGIRMGDGKQGKRATLWEKKKKIKKGRGWKKQQLV